MKHVVIIICMLLVLNCAVKETTIDPPAEVGYFFGGSGDDEGRAILEGRDGGFWIVGETGSYGNGQTDTWVIKTNRDFDQEWSRTYGGTEEDHPRSAILSSGQGIVFSGYSGNYSNRVGSIFLKKINSSGDIVWSRNFSDGNWDMGGYVQPTSDGGYVIAGANGQDDQHTKFWLIKTNSSGIKMWDKTYGGTGGGLINSVLETPDGGFLLYGEGTWDGEDDYSVWQGIMIKVNQSGEEIWHTTFGGPQSEEGYGSARLSDGGFVGVGFTNSNGFTGGYMAKANPDGNNLWFKQLSNISGFRIMATPDGGFLIHGNSGRALGLARFDSEGNQAWHQTFGPTDMQISAYAFSPTSTGDFVFAGYGVRDNNRDVFVMRTDSDGREVR